MLPPPHEPSHARPPSHRSNGSRAAAAVERARELGAGPAPPRPPAPPRRWLLCGDPQTTPERFFDVLDRHGALGDEGWLAPEVGLVSMGDHFDFHMGAKEAEPSGREILGWLAAQPPDRVVLLAGNHDIARVAELAFETDGSFADAKALAREIERARSEARAGEKARLEAEFLARFPRIPAPGMVLKDYASFSEAQRALVERLLLAGRMRLSATARLGETSLLLTHAAVTERELSLLGAGPADPAALVARRLEELLARALDGVRAAWEIGQLAALDLGPVHVAGTAGREGGGLLYHRPSRADRPDADLTWELDRAAPRRFDPRALPRGLAQVAGHSGHGRCVRALPGWVDAAASGEHLALRTLRSWELGAAYEAGIRPHAAGEATLYLIDPGFADSPLDEIALLEVDEVFVGG